jgi:glycerophosphoryl diester phosphodiesterase
MFRPFIISALLVIITFFGFMQSNKTIDIQGHRGARAYMPENTLPSFIKAIKLGATTLEMDAIISQDSQVVVSHAPYLDYEICKDINGEDIKREDEITYNLYQMKYEDIAKCDCGTKIHSLFPNQEKFKAYKPLLSDVIESIESYTKKNKLPAVKYNIETKSTKEGDNIFHPAPAAFSRLVLNVIKKHKIQDRCILQSFDVRTLQEVHKMDPSIKTSLLVENTEGFNENLKKLGFLPDIYSPIFQLVDATLVKQVHEKKIDLVPWTINEYNDIKKMVALGVDGIISDYPDRVKEVVDSKK